MSNTNLTKLSGFDEDKNKTINQIGFMQGRLSSVSEEGVIQEFPWETWKEEFSIAKECGFKLIEWVLESKDWGKNPILLGPGRKEIIQLQKMKAALYYI